MLFSENITLDIHGFYRSNSARKHRAQVIDLGVGDEF